MLTVVERLRRRVPSGDGGFTLIEAVVALLIAAIIFGALAMSLTIGLRASMTGRADQQATDFMTRQVERARTQSLAALAMSASDSQLNSAGDSRIGNCAGVLCIDPGTGVKENLHVVPAGAWLATHTTTSQDSQTNNTKYVLRSYVTELPGQDATQTLRFTVFVDYNVGSSPRSKSISTIISKVQRGLPLPIFKLTSTTPTSVVVNPGATMTYGFQLVNQGAPDRWNLTLSGSLSSWSWTLYKDVDADGFYDVGTDLPLTDTNGDGTIDSDRLDPNGSLSFLAVHTTSVSDPASSGTLTVTATSVAQPTATGATHSVSVTGAIQIGAITSSTTTSATSTPPPTTPATDCNTAVAPSVTAASGFSATQFSLHNFSGPPGSATTAQASLGMTRDNATYASTLYPYSTDVSASPGRALNPVGSLTATQIMALTDTSRYVQWSFTTGAKGSVSLPALVRVWVGGAGGAAFSSGQLTAVVFAKGAPLGYGTASVAGCTGFSKSFVPISGSTNVTLNKNVTYGVRLVNAGSTQVQVAYDTAVYPAALTLGVK